MSNNRLALYVGVFMVFASACLVFLAFRVTNINDNHYAKTYSVLAEFDQIGGLKKSSPVRIAGVKIGEVSDIGLNANNYRASVSISIYDYIKIPDDSTVQIFTEGLLGASYLGVSPGFSETMLKDQALLVHTRSAMVLENLIGHLLFSLKSNEKGADKN